jgi:hypothetical protein
LARPNPLLLAAEAILIHPPSGKRNSANFAKNNALLGTKFIANSSLLARVGVS